MISDLSPSLSEFLRDYVSSYEELEALLFLARVPVRAWLASEIAASLRINVDSVETALGELLATGALLQTVPVASGVSFLYAPSEQSLGTQVSELQRAYVEQRLAVVQVMNANAMQRMRSSAARRLAEAFRFERSKK